MIFRKGSPFYVTNFTINKFPFFIYIRLVTIYSGTRLFIYRLTQNVSPHNLRKEYLGISEPVVFITLYLGKTAQYSEKKVVEHYIWKKLLMTLNLEKIDNKFGENIVKAYKKTAAL